MRTPCSITTRKKTPPARSPYSPEAIKLCCRCSKHVTEYGDVRFQRAEDKCKDCNGILHRTCLQHESTSKCRPVSGPVGIKVQGCKCGLRACYLICIDRWFAFTKGDCQKRQSCATTIRGHH